VVSIFLLVVLRFFCQPECTCPLTWEHVYLTFLVSAVSNYINYICNPQCHLDCVCLVLFIHFVFILRTVYPATDLTCFVSSVSVLHPCFFCTVQFLHPYVSDGTAIVCIISTLFLIVCLKYLPSSSSCCFIPYCYVWREEYGQRLFFSVVISSVLLVLCEKLYRVFDFLIRYDRGLWVNKSLACTVLYFYTHLPWHKLWYDFPFISVTVVFFWLLMIHFYNMTYKERIITRFWYHVDKECISLCPCITSKG
jgi:hypothetical protein